MTNNNYEWPCRFTPHKAMKWRNARNFDDTFLRSCPFCNYDDVIEKVDGIYCNSPYCCGTMRLPKALPSMLRTLWNLRKDDDAIKKLIDSWRERTETDSAFAVCADELDKLMEDNF